MRNRVAVLLMVGVMLIFALLFARVIVKNRALPYAEFAEKKLRILTYSTFVGSSGPGAEIFDQFKKTHGCEIEVQTSGDAGLLLERLHLAQVSAPFDLVIGLDQFALNDAREKSAWRKIEVDRTDWQEPVRGGSDVHFIAFDWSPMAFVYRQDGIAAPTNFGDLLSPRFHGRIALQDPRSSSPGMQFMSWVKATQGNHSVKFLEQLKPNIQSVSPSWAFSYGLFKKRQADLVFSYVTSLAFHWGLEKDRNYQIAVFPEGHPVQIEYAAVPASCRECELAETFLREMLQPEAQRLIMQKNFMFPVIKGLEAGTIFATLPKVKSLVPTDSKGVDLSDWDKVFKR